MCKTKMATNATEPTHRSPRTRQTQTPRTPTTRSSQTVSPPTSTATSSIHTMSSSTNTKASSSTSISSGTSLSSLRFSLSENPHIYDITEIRTATNNFLAKHYSSSASTACWRCNLRGKNTIVFQRKFRRKIETNQLRERLSVICRSHHGSIIRLLGASLSGDHIYLVYEFIEGANLTDCLRNSRNPNFTVLSTWMSRMQIATDLAHGLDYIHNKTGLNISIVHNHIKSSSIIVTEPSFIAKICHFGTSQLCGETDENEIGKGKKAETGEIVEVDERSEKLTRSNSGNMQFAGVRGYMSPEFQTSGVATQKSDVYAFGVVILELLSGEEPFKYRFDKRSGEFIRTSVIDTARAAVDSGGEGPIRKWVDRRLKDSFPVEVAEKVTRLALDCVHVDPNERPDMGRVAGKLSKLYLQSNKWSESMRIPTGISVSLGPR
ncbi:hypothetical protein SLEP1_g13815 [Rubroshorea leprosula]|uniref:Protein kinase domain-containing protein n=1 Tax=Rubroshorea leprosula TaxID=152421 RepID=A0AAV5IRR8_9ROSI|nr:hypothetical protein SLEP1_g13815 [Rubroshorea leprosula]